MTRRILLAVTVVVLYGGWVPTWAHSQAGVNCASFTYQEDAQAYFDAHPGDPAGLDGPPGPAFEGIQNVACEALPHRPAPAKTTTTVATTSTVRPAPASQAAVRLTG